MPFDDETTGQPVKPRSGRVHDDNYVLNEIKEARLSTRDNFDRDIANPLKDLIDVAGEKQFTPERLRYFKDGTRVFLQYGTDSTFSETDQGHQLTPGGFQIARATVNVEGTGSNTNITASAIGGNREVYPGDIALILVRSDTAGDFKIDVLTAQNS